MDKDRPNSQSERFAVSDELSLPSFTQGLESSLRSGHTLQVDGTNVVRVPFGVRQPRRQRPERPERLATLVLPFQPQGNPNPPPQAA